MNWRSDNRPIATIVLVGICVLVFLYQMTLPALEEYRFLLKTGLIPRRLLTSADLPAPLDIIPASATLVTSMFVHSGVAHIIVNMIVLVSFGTLVEAMLGRPRYLIIYFLSGIAGGLVHAFVMPTSETPVIGASGAISGVMAAAFLAAPKMRILLFIVPMPFYIAIALILGAHAVAIVIDWEPGIAWWAHLGGFAAGALLFVLLRPRTRRADPFT